MTSILRRAAVAASLAFSAAVLPAFANGNAPTAPDAKAPETFVPITGGGARSCSSDFHPAGLALTLNASLDDLLKPGQGPVDEDSINVARMIAQMTGDSSMIEKEMEKYDFTKLQSNLPKLTDLLREEVNPAMRNFTAAQINAGDPAFIAAMNEALGRISSRFEAMTGLSINIDITGGGSAPMPSDSCKVVAVPAPN